MFGVVGVPDTYQAAPGFTGLDGALVRAFDGTAYSPWSSIIFEVSNQQPLSTSGKLQVHWGKQLYVNLKSYVTDSDNDPLAVTLLAQTSHGSLTLINGLNYK